MKQVKLLAHLHAAGSRKGRVRSFLKLQRYLDQYRGHSLSYLITQSSFSYLAMLKFATDTIKIASISLCA
ncbi:hypothetical protein HanHA89_Chr12g0462771 [Helianthus annuus]|nr:hypothetical protein HanHA89_Chr12g0462771 [Helianthus annuus]